MQENINVYCTYKRLFITGGFPGGATGRELPANAGGVGDMGWIRWEDHLVEGMATHSSILDGESHGQRSLEGYSSQGHKESWVTEAT